MVAELRAERRLVQPWGRSPGPSAGRGRAGRTSPSSGPERCRDALVAERQLGKHGEAAWKAGAWRGVCSGGARRSRAGRVGGRARCGVRGVRCGGLGGMSGVRCGGLGGEAVHRVKCGVLCGMHRRAVRGVRGAGCGAGLAEIWALEGRGRSPRSPLGSGADTGASLQDAPGRSLWAAAFPGAEPLSRGCATSACSEPSCAGWGAGVWWEEGKIKTKTAEKALLGCLGKSP